MRRLRLGSALAGALGCMALSVAVCAALWPHAREATAILAAQDDPATLSDIHINSALRSNQALVADHIEAALAEGDSDLANRFVSNALGALAVSSVVMPAIFLVVAALILGILMGRLVENQRTTLGTLKALGYADRRLLAHVLEFGLAVGLAGGALGCGLGYGLAGALTRLYTRFFEFPALVTRPSASQAKEENPSVICWPYASEPKK